MIPASYNCCILYNSITALISVYSLFLLKANIEQNTEIKQIIKGQANDSKEKEHHTIKNTKKVGRNDPCICGSGKKYKNCCGK